MPGLQRIFSMSLPSVEQAARTMYELLPFTAFAAARKTLPSPPASWRKSSPESDVLYASQRKTYDAPDFKPENTYTSGLFVLPMFETCRELLASLLHEYAFLSNDGSVMKYG